MFNTFKTALEQLDVQLDEISYFIDKISSNPISRSTVAYNAVIISLYGCYENCVSLIAEELIRQISDNSSNYAEIPTDMKISNINLSADFLNAQQRYKGYNLDKSEVIRNIYSGKITNKLLLKHGGNLSITVLSEYLKSLGIKNVVQLILNDPQFIKYYSEIKMISLESAKEYLQKNDDNSYFYYLGEIISQRNTIAHSWKSDEKVDYTIIKHEWIKFIRVLCECIYNIVVRYYSEWLVKYNKLFCPMKFEIYGSSVVGFYDVIPNYSKNNDIILIKKGDSLHIGKVINVEVHNGHNTSIKIEGYSLDKDKEKDYSFYFDRDFLKS